MTSPTYNKTKIVATVGPASNNKDTLRKLILAGADVFRLNFSHGKHEDHEKVIHLIRELNKELGTYVGILQDLQGPKIRVQEVENNGVELLPGAKFTITTIQQLGTAEKASTSYQALPKDVKAGDAILIDDGKLELKVLSTDGVEVVTEVVYGGTLKSKKGINLPNTAVSAPSLTEKDMEDLLFGLKHQVDWVALSFVRKASDIEQLRKIVLEHNKHTKIVAKVEKPEAIANMDEIIASTDAVMVARGDLGVEIPNEEVPLIQKQLVRKCNVAGKPVIVATQMLESMIDNPRPTRAETSDVANAVMDGADCVMLSAESASGKYPVEAVKTMVRIIRNVEEKFSSLYNKDFGLDAGSSYYYSDQVIHAACELAKSTNAKAICSITGSGYSAFRISRHRPKSDIFIFTRHQHLLTRMSLLWGVRAYYYERNKSDDQTFDEIESILLENNHVRPGEVFVKISSLPMEARQHANDIRLINVPVRN